MVSTGIVVVLQEDARAIERCLLRRWNRVGFGGLRGAPGEGERDDGRGDEALVGTCGVHGTTVRGGGMGALRARYGNGMGRNPCALTMGAPGRRMRNMSVWVLGPLLTDGGPLSPRERSVLSALVLRAGFAVTPDELADAVWGDGPPGTWPKQLQASIGLVRRSIGGRTIATGTGGYTINLDPDSVDAVRFDRLVDAARVHLGSDDPARAADALDRALDLWRGAPYPDLQSWPPAVVESQRLTEVRVEAEELRLGARLALGEHDSAVAGAERLVREQPLREQRWSLLATALYRSGRQADALAAIRSARERLAEELGIEPGEDLRRLELAILRHDSDLELGDPPATPSDVCPYRGLTPFGVDDEDDFFGRDDDIDSALGRLARSPFLAVTGASGSGKSSLVRAGLVPVLRRRGDRVLIRTPSSGLGTAIRDAISERRGGQVVVVDQFEELFHAGVGASEVDDAGRAVADAIEHGASVILVVRSDFLDECAAQPALGRLFAQGVHLVGRMSPDSLRDAIEQPARRAGLRLEPGLTELILRDATGGTGSLPHVSHALVETWLRREGGTLTVAGYEASGGISGAIAQSADRLYQSLDASQRVMCRSTLTRLVALTPDGSPLRRRVQSRALRADAARDEVLSLLADARLVSTEADSVAVAHESLAIAWPRLHAWLEEDAASSRILATLSTAAETWEADGRPEEDLYRGSRLQAAREWRDAAPRDLTDTESAFLAAASARETSEKEMLAERVRQDRRQNRRLRGILAAAAGLIVLLMGVGSVAVVASGEAAKQRDSAKIEALVSTALALRTSELDVSALLAAEAYRRWPDDPRTHSGLMGVLQSAGGFLGHVFIDEMDWFGGAVIPGTDDALLLDLDGNAGVFDLATGERHRELDFRLSEAAPPLPLVSVSADGGTAAVLWPVEVQEDGPFYYGRSVASELAIIDIASGRRLLGPERLEVGTGALAVRHDGGVVAVADSNDGHVVIFDVDSGTRHGIVDEKPVAITLDSIAAAVAFTPTGQLVVGRLDDSLSIVEPTTGVIVRRYEVPSASSNVAMAVTSDGTIVASGDRSMAAVNAATGAVLWAADVGSKFPGSGCPWLAISEPIGTVYCGGHFGHIVERDLHSGVATGRPMDPLLGTTGPVAVTASGTQLVTIGGTHAVSSSWLLDGSGATQRLVGRGMRSVGGYSPSGTRMLVADRGDRPPWDDVDQEVSIWDARADRKIASIQGPIRSPEWAGEDAVVAYFPDVGAFQLIDVGDGSVIATLPKTSLGTWTSQAGTRLHVAVAGGELWTYDTENGERIEPTLEFEGELWTLSASPDGSRMALVSLDPEVGELNTSILDTESGDVVASESLVAAPIVMLSASEFLGASDNRVARYAIESMEPVGTLPGGGGGIGQLTVSEDGSTLLVSAADDSAMVFDLPSATRLGDPIRGDGARLRPDGDQVAVNVADGILLWNLVPDQQFEAVCRIGGRDLTDAEWATYLDELGGPRSTCELD